MSYRDSYNKNDNLKPQHQSKALSVLFDIKPELLISPQISKKSNSKLYRKKESLKERHTTSPKNLHEKSPVNEKFGYLRNASSNILKTQEKTPNAEDLQEKKPLMKKLELIQKEIELTKSWKKTGSRDEVRQYKKKLSFLVKKVENFLVSSSRFQKMLHEKLGESVALVYEEEHNLLIQHIKSTTQGLDIGLIKSPLSSPLKSCKSQMPDDNFFFEPKSANALEKVKIEKNKTKKMQIELRNELNKKDTEMKNIRDRLIELEIIEKNKLEIEKKFIKASQDWNLTKQDLIKENNFFKSECVKYEEKTHELNTKITEILNENKIIKEKFDETIQENYKFSESLQTFDRLYNYTKKWVEKSVEESQNNFEAGFKDMGNKIEEKDMELKIMQKNLEKALKYKGELKGNLDLKYENDRLVEKINGLEESLNEIFKNSQNSERNAEKANFNCREGGRKLKDKKNIILGLKNEKNSIEKTLVDLSTEYETIKIELMGKNSEINDLTNKIKDLNSQIMTMHKDKDFIEKILLKNEEKNKENTELSNKILQIFNDLEKTQKEKKELMNRVSGLTLESQETQTKVHELIQENNALKSKILKVDQESETLRVEYKKMQKINEESIGLFESIKEKNKQISNLQTKLNEKEDLLLNANSKEQEITMSLKEKDDIIKNLRCQIIEFENMDKKLSETTEHIKKLTEKQRKKVQEIEILNAKLVENEQKYEELAYKQKEAEDQIDNLKQIISNKDNNYKELNTQCEKYKEIVKMHEEKHKKLSPLNSINKNTISPKEININIQNEIKLLQEKNIELTNKKNKEIEKMQEDLEEMKQIIKIKEKSIENFESSLKDQENLVKALNSKDSYISKIIEKVDILTKTLEDKNVLITSLQLTITNSVNEYKEMENKLKSLEEIPVLIKEKGKLQDSLNNSIKNNETLEKLLKEKGDLLKIKINQIKEIKPLREGNRELNDKVNSLFSENKTLSKQAEILTEEILMKEKLIKKLLSENVIIENLSGKIQEKDEELNELKARIIQEQKSTQTSAQLYETLLKEKEDEINRLKKTIEKLMEKIKITTQSSSVETETLSNQVVVLQKELDCIKFELSSLQQINYKLIKEENNYKNKIFSLEKENAANKSDIENFLKQITETKCDNQKNLSTKLEEFQKQINELNKKNQELISQFEESEILDKEEIARLNNELIMQLQINEAHEKEINILVQMSVTAENKVKSYHCENCKTLKKKISELEYTVNQAEESLGGYFNNTLVESIKELLSSKTQSYNNFSSITTNKQFSVKNISKIPKPSHFKMTNRQSVELKSEISDELLNKYSLASERIKRSNSSALPDFSDLINELNDEKIESEKYLTQIKILKENIRELERKLKRTEDVNDKINAEVLKDALLKMFRSIPIQNSEIEGMIHLVFSIISVPREEVIKLESERKAKSPKLFGVF
ncbi:hypothetical protein SteCoe_30291 [Stentor coeruleus]|uniref:GRIP domain-containing protein n=1 Tax=Stentor coeruleus TaxID=5963 RepID=A0A1R2B488_9CILI|nr:hypothetical protein SteCoe_30291 [Stentor coeruleus]